MNRRDLIALLGGLALLPSRVFAQRSDRVYRIGILTLGETSELGAKQRALFKKTLTEQGWTEGNNIQIEYRSAANDTNRIPTLVTELLKLDLDIVVSQGRLFAKELARQTKTTPVVFVSVNDPVESGIVASLSHPGGNVTGFANFEPTLFGKYVEILKEITPSITSVTVMQNPDNISGTARPLFEKAARYLGVEIVFAPARDATEIERVISSLADQPNHGLFVAGDPLFGTGQNLHLISSLATRYRVRAVYSFRHLAEAGGLISYGNDLVDQYRQAAGYVDRILRGAQPADLPVQGPTKFEMVINLKTAKAIGVTIPPTLIARADEVIE